MKKVARLRIPLEEHTAAGGSDQTGVRTTGRIKKPKAVFDPSDNYLPRSQRNAALSLSANSSAGFPANAAVAALKRETPPQEALHGKRLSQSSGTSTATTSISDASDACFVCLKREAKRGTSAKNNKMVACLECDRRVHKLCLKVDFEDHELLRLNFRCDNCCLCDLCAAFGDVDTKTNKELVTCAKCVKSYHLTCHIPNVLKYQQFQRNWKCNKCSAPTLGNGSSMLPVKTIREIIGGEPPKLLKPSPSVSPQQHSVNIAAAAAEAKTAAVKRQKTEKATINGTEERSECDVAAEAVPPKKQKRNEANAVVAATSNTRFSPIEPDVPDVKYWSVEQVAEFFAKYFPNEAHVFKEHEIDGMSLLLLKRSDVIKKLPIKLGPSLRIYSLILKIQTQLNDPTLGWNCEL